MFFILERFYCLYVDYLEFWHREFERIAVVLVLKDENMKNIVKSFFGLVIYEKAEKTVKLKSQEGYFLK